jgi:hypothetical protein
LVHGVAKNHSVCNTAHTGTKGFDLPPEGTQEKVVEPALERIEIEPQEKTSSNGF